MLFGEYAPHLGEELKTLKFHDFCHFLNGTTANHSVRSAALSHTAGALPWRSASRRKAVTSARPVASAMSCAPGLSSLQKKCARTRAAAIVYDRKTRDRSRHEAPCHEFWKWRLLLQMGFLGTKPATR